MITMPLMLNDCCAKNSNVLNRGWVHSPICSPFSTLLSARLGTFALANPFSRHLRSRSNQNHILCVYLFQNVYQQQGVYFPSPVS
jgi:hypothetical protein